ncbi:MAG: hypothetical protein P4N59_18275 [Negativicutes bacterium]|nr:hypothetical protein [Negativicutes bacterium]
MSKWTKMIISIIFSVFVYETSGEIGRVFSIASPLIYKTLWYFAIGIPGAFYLLKQLKQYFWAVTATGIEHDGQCISYDSIEWMYSYVISYVPLHKVLGFWAVRPEDDHKDNLRKTTGRDGGFLNVPDIIKLLSVRPAWNQWHVTNWIIKIAPGQPGEELRVNYAPRGAYARGNFALFLAAVPAGLLLMLLAALTLVMQYSFLKVMLFLVVVFVAWFGVPGIWQVEVSVTADGVTLQNKKGREHFLAFADIAKIERGFFRTKVTAKDGAVLHFPRACYLLPDLIEELAGLAKG